MSSPKKSTTSQPSSGTRQKRSRQNSDTHSVSKRRIDSGIAPSPQFRRASSPGKNVHFGRNLIQGPTVTDPRRRSESPSRSALRDNAHDDPSVQLQSDIIRSLPNGKVRVDRHLDICSSINKMKADIKAIAEKFPEPKLTRNRDVFDSLMKYENRYLIRYIGCLAVGGISGVDGWRALLKDKMCRQGLICGIMSRALKAEVFDALYFGAHGLFQADLADLERSLPQKDGFYRTEKRARMIESYPESGFDQQAPVDIIRVALQLEAMLLPFWELGSQAEIWELEMRNTIIGIVHEAAEISRQMRKDRYSVYYWPPTFKDEEFDPARMECFNLEHMIRNSPYDKKEVNGIDRAILREGYDEKSEAIVRVVCFPGLVEYKKGGGELAKNELVERNRSPERGTPNAQRQRKISGKNDQGPLTGKEGFRTTIISKSGVVLQWGKQRLLTKDAGTAAHLDAMKSGNLDKYNKNYEGFVDLYDYFQEQIVKPAEEDKREPWIPIRFFSRSVSPTASSPAITTTKASAQSSIPSSSARKSRNPSNVRGRK